jgi:hypothetical protein
MEDREDHSGNHGGEDSSSDEKCDNSDDDDNNVLVCLAFISLRIHVSCSCSSLIVSPPLGQPLLHLHELLLQRHCVAAPVYIHRSLCNRCRSGMTAWSVGFSRQRRSLGT